MTPGIYEFGPCQSVMAYGGRSGDIERRWGEHRSMLRRNKHHCIRLQRAWNKYGEDTFEFIILEVIENPGERRAAEQKWLDKRHAEKTCYNVAIAAGSNGPMAEETKQKLREVNMGNQYAKGSKHTKEWKQAKSEGMMGNQNARGKHSEEICQAKSERQMGHPVSAATRQRLGDANGRPYPAFEHMETGEIIPAGVNLGCLCRERGLVRNHMCNVKNGKRPHHKGWVLLVERMRAAQSQFSNPPRCPS